MVDFRKRLNKRDLDKPVNPLDLYESLDRRSETGPLRPAQEYILNEWFSKKRSKKNQIVKLHTGQGKTLIGLLILHSKLNEGNAPCLYICPNIYLVRQTVQEAKKFGIPYCTIENGNDLPDTFLNGKRILITHVQKVFNGKSIFGLNNDSIFVDSIIMDDSQACIDAIRASFTLRIRKEEALYDHFLSLFEADLIGQGEGSYLDIKNGKYETLLPIPYWSWNNKKTEVLKLLADNVSENSSILFSWPILKDKVENYRGIVSGNQIEITPYFIPIHHFGSFDRARHRVLMSATTQDDAFFIKGLQFDIAAIQEPLIDESQKWSGEKMLLLPSLVDDSLSREEVITKLAQPVPKDFGIVSLVPSFRMADLYKDSGAEIVNQQNIFDVIQQLKAGEVDKTVVVVNRYDGIDLPDESCRLLILDSKPFFEILADRYEEICRPQSEVINTKVAQKVEQGLGRSVRGEKDYSVIILIGGDLIKFIKSSHTNRYFSAQTRQQIEIGLEIAEAAKDDLKKGDPPSKVLNSLLKQSFDRDEGWKQFYKERMNEISNDRWDKKSLFELFQRENAAERHNYNQDYESAVETMQRIIDIDCNNDSEKGWYLQCLARYKYNLSQVESNLLQKSAFKFNFQLLHPKDGISYKKIAFINEDRVQRIREFIAMHDSYEELMLSINNVIDLLNFGITSEKFEAALQELGKALGFVSQRPDKEYKKGPDNLWCGVDDRYFLFECKSEVLDSRQEITKHEAAQMNSHCGWFEEEYGNKSVKRILIVPVKELSYYASFTHEVEIMRKTALKKLRENVMAFFKEFKNYNIHEIGDEKIQRFIDQNNLNVQNLWGEYSEKYFQYKSGK